MRPIWARVSGLSSSAAVPFTMLLARSCIGGGPLDRSRFCSLTSSRAPSVAPLAACFGVAAQPPRTVAARNPVRIQCAAPERSKPAVFILTLSRACCAGEQEADSVPPTCLRPEVGRPKYPDQQEGAHQYASVSSTPGYPAKNHTHHAVIIVPCPMRIPTWLHISTRSARSFTYLRQ